MDVITAIGLTIGSLVALAPLGYVAYVDAGGIYTVVKRAQAKKRASDKTCRLDSDCPPGYVCRGGACVPDGA